MSPPKKAKKLAKAKVKTLLEEYHSIEHNAEGFAAEVERQLTEILEQARIPLAVPIQRRVKSWSSIAEKIERKELILDVIQDLHDLIGVRAILLFKRDVETACTLIDQAFNVISREDRFERLQDSQFGYASMHFVIELPIEWLKLPTVQRFAGLRAELQVRSVAQHLWAAASHVLQYKKEASVPKPVRRAIYRVSALLEMIDLEFERVLSDRDQYRQKLDTTSGQGNLDVDSLARVITDVLPSENRLEEETFEDLLTDLLWFGINTPENLRNLLQAHKAKVLSKDKEEAKQRLGDVSGVFKARAERGVFWALTGLTRAALELEFGEKWLRYKHARWLWITQMALSDPVKTALGKSNLRTAIELVTTPEAQLVQQSELTPEQLAEIKKELKVLGLELGMSLASAKSALMEAPIIRKQVAEHLRSK